jgi:uncharacterized membrane protein YjjP (DUF1212 family)
MSARALGVNGQFRYTLSCMMVSYSDEATRTTKSQMIQASEGVDLGKLKDTHQIYYEVVHKKIDAAEALSRLTQVVNREPLYGRWFLILMFGFASASVAPFAFGARFIDLPVAGFLGMILGFLHLSFGARSDMFVITAAVLTSFLSRVFGSIGGGKLFCFSTLAQSSIAMILPGYTLRKQSSKR